LDGFDVFEPGLFEKVLEEGGGGRGTLHRGKCGSKMSNVDFQGIVRLHTAVVAVDVDIGFS
jgi:hypothetical protein